MEIDQIINQLLEIVVDHGPRIIGSILVLIIGMWIIKAFTRRIKNLLSKRNYDKSLSSFLVSLLSMLLKVLLVVSILGMLGIEMTSFIAILGAAGLAIGLALSGTLQNFAGGAMILVFKPFKVGDFIDAQGHTGTVNQIQIFNTILKTPDNKTIIIPNGGLFNASMTNFSTEDRRRVDWTIGIAYGDDVDKAKDVIRRLCNEDPRILKDPELFVAVAELAESSINFTLRVWVESKDHWPVFFDMNEKVYKTFSKEGLHIPYPQMDVHLHK